MSPWWNVSSQQSKGFWWSFAFCGLFFFLTACDSGGKIEFRDGYRNSENQVSKFNLVPASVAIATEPGKNSSNGYHAKIQINPLKGQALTSPDGYQIKLKNTRRNQ